MLFKGNGFAEALTPLWEHPQVTKFARVEQLFFLRGFMKKFFYIFIFLMFGLFFPNKSFALDEISFIYLNGSNTNTIESKEEFLKGVDYLHREIIEQFSSDELIKTKWLDNGNLTINKKAIPFYWGDFSKNEIFRSDADCYNGNFIPLRITA